jgi:hypothetical protein
MKNKLLLAGLVMILIALYSCEDSKKIQYYNLNIELNEPLPNLKETDVLPDYLKVFVNYTDTSFSNALLVPDVTFTRIDIQSSNSVKLEPPLTWVNRFRKGRDMLPSEYLKEDYDNLIGKLNTPKILTEPKGKVAEANTESTEYGDNTFCLNIYKVKPDSIKTIRDKITHKLCSSKGNITITLRISNKHVDLPQTVPASIPKDTLVKDNGSVTQTVKPQIIKKDKTSPIVPNTKPISENITANSFDEYLQKIGDKTIPYPEKANLKSKFIENYFAGENSTVVIIGANGTEVGHPKVKDFIEDLSQRNFKFKVLGKKNNDNQKITTLNIQEL